MQRGQCWLSQGKKGPPRWIPLPAWHPRVLVQEALRWQLVPTFPAPPFQAASLPASTFCSWAVKAPAPSLSTLQCAFHVHRKVTQGPLPPWGIAKRFVSYNPFLLHSLLPEASTSLLLGPPPRAHRAQRGPLEGLLTGRTAGDTGLGPPPQGHQEQQAAFPCAR